MKGIIRKTRFSQYGLSSLALLTLMTPGCAWIERQTNLDLPENKMSTTSTSVATGAALGAGLGAIVGSSTGSAGEGLVIGTMAGAMAGGIIGNQIEQQDAAIGKQQETLTRQNEMISAQDREIQGLRESLSDRFPNNTPSRTGKGFSLDSYHGNPRAKHLDGSSAMQRSIAPSSRARLSESLSEPPVRTPRAALGTRSQAKISRPEPTHQIAKSTPTPLTEAEKIQVASVAPVSNQLPPPARPEVKPMASSHQEKTLGAVGVKKSSSPSVAATTPSDNSQVAALPPTAKSDAVTTTDSAVKPTEKNGTPIFSSASVDLSKQGGAACEEAQNEWGRSQHATSEADKIFYLKRAIRLCPQNSSYRVEIGKLYAGIGLIDEARSEYLQAIDLDPENEVAHQQLGSLEQAGGQK